MRNLVALFLTLLIALSNISAEEYNLYIPDIDQCTNFGSDPSTLGNTKIKVNYVDLTYDSTTETFTVEVKVDNSRGQTANLFHMVLTDGAMPQGETAAAHIYFDATDINSPKANVFVYNGHGDNVCNNAPGSWEQANLSNTFYEPGDSIISSSSTDVLEATVVSIGNSRTYRLVLNTKNINAYNPILRQKVAQMGDSYPYAYEGVKFNDKVGVWFWAAADAETAYDGNGLLSHLCTSICAVCDQENFETKKKPLCSGSSASKNPVTELEKVTVSISVRDPDAADADNPTMTVSYSGLPVGAKPGVPEGGQVPLDIDGNGTVTITWVPQIGDAGSYNINATFSKDYGLGQLVTQCTSLTVVVKPGTPSCEAADKAYINAADTNLSNLAVLANNLKNKAAIQRGKIGNKRPIDDFDANAEQEDGWAAYNALRNGDNTLLFQCSQVNFCKDSNGNLIESGQLIKVLDNEATTFKTALENLLSIASSRVVKYKRARKQVLIQIRGLDKKTAARKVKRQAKKINNKITQYFSVANSQFDIHLTNYGNTIYNCPNWR